MCLTEEDDKSFPNIAKAFEYMSAVVDLTRIYFFINYVCVRRNKYFFLHGAVKQSFLIFSK